MTILHSGSTVGPFDLLLLASRPLRLPDPVTVSSNRENTPSVPEDEWMKLHTTTGLRLCILGNLSRETELKSPS